MKYPDYGWCIDNNGKELYTAETKRLSSVFPSERQLSFLNMEYYNFIHFGINTFYNREWGDGKEDISVFNPKKLDTDQWCKVLKDTGSKGIIITAKHHDGFCLFDTKHTDHCVMNTPFKRDIVKELSESCRKYDLKLGIYLSPWDRHDSRYGTEQYNDYFVSQLTELCTNYGELFCLWFDGACGEGPNGKKQVYDWERYYETIRKYQPDAVISISGPDVRWIGNEGGRVRKSEWSVIPDEKDSVDAVAENSQQNADETKTMAKKLSDRDEDLGSRELLKNYEKLVFKPAEADVSINMGWFHTSNIFAFARRGRSAEKLAEIYWNSVGGNASMLLNVPPNKDGLIGKSEVRRLQKFTSLVSKPFEKEIGNCSFSLVTKDGQKRKADATFDEKGESYTFGNDELAISVGFSKVQKLSMISLREDLTKSQRVEQFHILAKLEDGSFCQVYDGTVIGSRKIVRFEYPVETDEILILPTQVRDNPVLKDIHLYSV
ncbi:MAG: alpha-L-fucosidase [Clostridia bacterium]|nr:alpha-L-fucosidase [Clostridia bacterium]